MPHYTCTGDCKGIAMQPGACQAGDCGKSGQPLTECNCTDGQHEELKDKNGEPGQGQSTLPNQNE
jgi:hypothetical protein